jgi:hypothetical protein
MSGDSFHMRETSPTSDVLPVNSYVLLKPPEGARDKLRMPKDGPYIYCCLWELIGISTPSRTYLLTQHKVTDTYTSNLCMFRYDSSSNMDHIEFAARNAGEFFVDRVSDHRGLTQRRSSMEFLMSWKGYLAKDDTWAPYKAV